MGRAFRFLMIDRPANPVFERFICRRLAGFSGLAARKRGKTALIIAFYYRTGD
ncbi:MAG: hypothetical protein LBC88_10180 [Spirochaetaceae bacterium]|nr:hypothetical protein [Spirochaetaceae bacterium]